MVVNALVHRDYLMTSTDIEISVYADRLEVISPGQLPNGITIDAMRDGARAARNQLLKDVMRDYDYMEHMGMGVPRTIIAGMRAHNGTEPDFEVANERLAVHAFVGDKLTSRQTGRLRGTGLPFAPVITTRGTPAEYVFRTAPGLYGPSHGASATSRSHAATCRTYSRYCVNASGMAAATCA